MSRIISLDVGNATVGVAAQDELKIMVSPVTTVRRGRSIKADVREVKQIIDDLDAELIVVGNPLDADNNEGIQAGKVKCFIERLARQTAVPFVFWDERYSTSEAHEELIGMDVSRAKRREIIDQMAAVIILESYLRDNIKG